MKKIILSIGFIIAMAAFSGIEASNINVSVNIGVQPAWGPVGYNYAAFYYFPDINVYYNVNQGLFHYPYRGAWVSARYLPGAYRNYDLYGLYKVVLTDNDPWRYNQRHIYDYRGYRGNRNQIVIRNSYDDRYRNSRRNDIRWYNDNNRGNTNYYGNNNNGRDNGHGNYNRSTADRQYGSDRNVPGYNNSREYNKPDNNRPGRSGNDRNGQRYATTTRSESSVRNSSEHRSEDRSRGNSSSRSDKGRSSSGRR